MRSKFAVREIDLEVGSIRLSVLKPADIDGLLHAARDENDLPFWAYLWPAAIGLARWLADYEPSAGPALELGAGIGVAGLVARRAGWSVIQTDLVKSALRFARVNGERNDAVGPLFAADWRSFPSMCPFNVVFGSDVLYEPTLHPSLLTVFDRCVAPGGMAVMADPCRNYALQFMAKLEELGWTVDAADAPGSPIDSDAVLIYTAQRPRCHGGE